ncbi:MAG: hypothetical protein ACAI35_10670 [Candidatus Methylacidiphilales bacterium]|nr:hypothetical protein [Candidatus Methylacidiphilales bacterium]
MSSQEESEGAQDFLSKARSEESAYQHNRQPTSNAAIDKKDKGIRLILKAH